MKKEFTLGVIGGGFMANAIVSGAIKSGVLKADQIQVSDINLESLQKFKTMGCLITNDNAYVAGNCSYLLFAVKPQSFDAVAKSLQGVEIERAISIMAGKEKAKIKSALPSLKRVCRVMPNLPCSIGYGMVAADPSDFTDEEDLLFIQNLFSSLGGYTVVTEDKMHAVTGISGSGPAYVFLFIKALMLAGKKQGLTEEEAQQLAIQTVRGGVEMFDRQKSEVDIDTLILRVCSKGGTTEKAMLSFEKDNFIQAVDNAVTACVERSKELAK